jgi:AcrR family transcriptional regulator
MNRRGEQTRNRLMDAAAPLFAERGIDGVTMVQLHEATGQRNKSAVQYHFGSRDGLVVAIIRRRQDHADRLRARMLARVEDGDLTGLIRALVHPAATNLRQQQGRHYLRIVPHVARRHAPAERLSGVGGLLGESLTRIGRHLDRLDPIVRDERLGSAFTFLIESLATRAAQVDGPAADLLDAEVFEAELVAMIEGLLTAPPPSVGGELVSADATGAA